MKVHSTATRASALLALMAALAGCAGGSSKNPAAHAGEAPSASSCAATVLDVLDDVAIRVYDEGISSARTASALSIIERSIPLRKAVERNDPRAVRAAAQALIATGHLTNLEVSRGPVVLASAGAPGALSPLRGTLVGAAGAPLATFITSVWADGGFISEVNGIAEGETALRSGTRSIPGSFELPPGELPNEGTLTVRHVSYRYTSFRVAVYPVGALRVYLFRSVRAAAGLCGRTPTETLVNTLGRVASQIYAAEIGRSALRQVHRVQHNQPLLRAVAARNPAATGLAIDNLLNEHVVRLRVSAGGRLLSDVGGPFVLAPLRARLAVGGRTIGSFVLSIQDDLGYRLLAQRLAGLDVVMHAGSRLVMSSFDPAPANVPAYGTFAYQRHTYRTFTLHAEAFPSGPLTITLLVPIPYS